MAAVSPRPQTAALNLSLKAGDPDTDPDPEQLGQLVCRTGRPVQRVHPNDFHRAAAEHRSPCAELDSGGALRGEAAAPRKQRELTPDASKDGRYWDRRRKNNDAAKRSRQRRRFTDIVLEAHMLRLARENDSLKAELLEMRERADWSAATVTARRPNPVLARLPPAPEQPRAGLPGALLHYDLDPPPSFQIQQPEANYPTQTTVSAVPRAPRPGPGPVYPMLGALGGAYQQPPTSAPRPRPGAPPANWPVVVSAAGRTENAATLPWPPQESGIQRGVIARGTVPDQRKGRPSARAEEADGGLSPGKGSPRLAETVVVVPAPPADRGPSGVASTTTPRSDPHWTRTSAGSPSPQPPPAAASPPIQRGGHTGRDKPPSPHSAFTSGLELSKLPHKLREKVKRSFPPSAAAADDEPGRPAGDDASPPPGKVRRAPASAESKPPATPGPTPRSGARREDELRPVCPVGLDPSFTPPPSSGSSSDGNASPVRVAGPLFDFPVKVEPPPPPMAAAFDASLSETHERMVRAAHALAALNKNSSSSLDQSPGGRSSPDGGPVERQGPGALDDREKYWDKRRRNNQAAKKCRDAKRLLIDYRAARSAYLEQENAQLRCETSVLQEEVTRLKELVKQRIDAETGDKPAAKPSPNSLTEPPRRKRPSSTQTCP